MALPNVHYLDFSEGNSPTDDPDWFNILWQLIDVSKPPRNSSNNSDQWRGIFEGDLIVFSSLLSGAGEFEAVRFVGPKSEDDALPLLPAGIEHPVFPTLIVQMAEERGISLRELYEAPFNAVLQSTSKITLFDLYSRDVAAYDEFWNDIPVARRRRPPSSTPWKFSLDECIWIETIDTFEKKGDEL